ncbi:MAG: hypothetical protein AB1556_07150 [Bacillota bacterium]
MGKRKRKKKALPKNRMRNITSSSLEDKIKKSGLFRGKNFTLVKGTGEKMSEVLLDFAEPLLDKLEDYPTIEKAISFAAVIWNLSLLPKSEQKKGLEDILKILGKDDPEMRKIGKDIAIMLLDRKEKCFPNNKRFIITYEFGMKNGEPWLNVASTILQQE